MGACRDLPVLRPLAVALNRFLNLIELIGGGRGGTPPPQWGLRSCATLVSRRQCHRPAVTGSGLNRHVATLPESQRRDPAQFYRAAPANYYAKFWHDHAIGHLAYGFPYDDYAEQSSFISHGNPQYLLVAVGW
jgi:hypothetical protein